MLIFSPFLSEKLLIAFVLLNFLVQCICQESPPPPQGDDTTAKVEEEDEIEKEQKEFRIVNEDNQGGPLLNYNFCKLTCFNITHTLCVSLSLFF